MSFEDQDLLDQIPHLRRFAVSLLRNRDHADDLVQDCVVRALSKKELFRAGTNLRSWLFTILHNLFIDGQRRGPGRLITFAGESAIDHVRVEPQQGDRLLLKELAAEIAALPSAQRFVLSLVIIQGMSYQEAAAVIGIPVGTVRSRLSRARSVLRENLSFKDGDEIIDLDARRPELKREQGPRETPDLQANDC